MTVTTEATTEAATERAEFVAALRAVADHFEQTDQALPFGKVRLQIIENNRDAYAREVRTLGGSRSKKLTDDIHEVNRDFGKVQVAVLALRESVCEAVKVGTETYVEHEVIESRPVTKTRDLMEWRCAPVLEVAG